MRRVAILSVTVAMLALMFAATPAHAIFGTPTRLFPFPFGSGPKLGGSHNGGADCAACTLIFGLVEQNMQLKKVDAMASMKMICSYLPIALVADGCTFIVEFLGDQVAPLLDNGESADTVCNVIQMCGSAEPVCRLFPKKHGRSEEQYKAHILEVRKKHSTGKFAKPGSLSAPFNICTIIPGICNVEEHLPFFDADNDRFSTFGPLRGTDWRGKDCNDTDKSVFPGRDTSDAVVDANCNGIYGTDPTTGKTYEDLWCSGTGSIGVAALGDSATAHFHIPPTYVTAKDLNNGTFAGLVRNLMNELDWPMLSWSTGHLNASSYLPDISGPDSSLYSLLAERNLCNHRDYTNLGVNGAKVANLPHFAELLNRNASSGVKPLFVVMSMIGNDVCHWDHTFATMTTPQQYRASVWSGLEAVDAFLPQGSQVLLVPLVDGRILYDEMHNRIHPIGETNQDVTYADLYDFLNCLDTSPCWGWMNSNSTVRNVTWEIADSLNDQLPDIAAAAAKPGTFKNIEVHYLGNIFDNALQKYKREFPGDAWKLIEPVDGFHPSQLANALLGQYLFNVTRNAGILPPENPNNAAIKAKFGDQGGY